MSINYKKSVPVQAYIDSIWECPYWNVTIWFSLVLLNLPIMMAILVPWNYYYYYYQQASTVYKRFWSTSKQMLRYLSLLEDIAASGEMVKTFMLTDSPTLMRQGFNMWVETTLKFLHDTPLGKRISLYKENGAWQHVDC